MNDKKLDAEVQAIRAKLVARTAHELVARKETIAMLLRMIGRSNEIVNRLNPPADGEDPVASLHRREAELLYPPIGTPSSDEFNRTTAEISAVIFALAAAEKTKATAIGVSRGNDEMAIRKFVDDACAMPPPRADARK
jgi:hypothetical protein